MAKPKGLPPHRWIISNKDTYLGYKAIKHTSKWPEIALVGQYGYATPHSDAAINVCIWSPIVANKLAKAYGLKTGYKHGDELCCKLPLSAARGILSLIKPFLTRKAQLDMLKLQFNVLGG